MILRLSFKPLPGRILSKPLQTVVLLSPGSVQVFSYSSDISFGLVLFNLGFPWFSLVLIVGDLPI